MHCGILGHGTYNRDPVEVVIVVVVTVEVDSAVVISNSYGKQ